MHHVVGEEYVGEMQAVLAWFPLQCNNARRKSSNPSGHTWVAQLQERTREHERTKARIQGRPMASPSHMHEERKTMRGKSAIEAKMRGWDANASCFQFRPLHAHCNGGEVVHFLEDW